MAKISINNLQKEYQKNVLALDNFSFESNENEFVVILGPSGSGKSTLLNLIAGLETPTNGSISIDNKNVTKLEARKRDVAMVFQDYALYPHMTVFDNIGFYLKIHKMPKKQIKAKVMKVANALQITDLLDRKPSSLSGGQKQRVAIARAMIRKPKVFLFDEPLSNLDAVLREKMRSELKELHNQTPSVFLYVTHDQIEALSMGDRIIIINEGSVQQIGTPKMIYNKPDNLFVASFIGVPHMNFISKDTYKKLGGTLDIPNNIIIGIRPEHIKINSCRKTNPYSGKVLYSENLGKEIRYHISYGNDEIVVCVSSSSKDESFKDNEYVQCKGYMNKYHYFDKDTEEAIKMNRLK